MSAREETRRAKRRTRIALAVCVCSVTFAGAAAAQATGESRGYVEGVAQSAFGNVTSQSYGVEFGLRIAPQLHIFGEAGQTRDTAPAALGQDARLIAGFLAQTQTGVSYTAKQPVTFGVAGLRFGKVIGTVVPYVMGGAGVARVKKDVTFSGGGTDITSTLTQFGVTLGTDLTGDETTAMVSAGGGVAWYPWNRLVLDLQFRYGRIMASDEGLNVSRAGIGVGFSF